MEMPVKGHTEDEKEDTDDEHKVFPAMCGPAYGAAIACALGAVAIARAQTTEVVLHNFETPPNGAFPNAGVIRDPAGNLYGTTINGGASNAGVVFKLDTTGHQTVLYSFTGGADGGSSLRRCERKTAVFHLFLATSRVNYSDVRLHDNIGRARIAVGRQSRGVEHCFERGCVKDLAEADSIHVH
jgi:uncharacterized repeat protein (TIGR03803 family)